MKFATLAALIATVSAAPDCDSKGCKMCMVQTEIATGRVKDTRCGPPMAECLTIAAGVNEEEPDSKLTCNPQEESTGCNVTMVFTEIANGKVQATKCAPSMAKCLQIAAQVKASEPKTLLTCNAKSQAVEDALISTAADCGANCPTQICMVQTEIATGRVKDTRCGPPMAECLTIAAEVNASEPDSVLACNADSQAVEDALISTASGSLGYGNKCVKSSECRDTLACAHYINMPSHQAAYDKIGWTCITADQCGTEFRKGNVECEGNAQASAGPALTPMPIAGPGNFLEQREKLNYFIDGRIMEIQTEALEQAALIFENAAMQN